MVDLSQLVFFIWESWRGNFDGAISTEDLTERSESLEEIYGAWVQRDKRDPFEEN